MSIGDQNQNISICSGFNLWTSAHGFHHLELTKSSLWRIFWMVILAVSCISLICLIIYYFYYVFAFAVYSRILLQNSATMPWPTTIICDRQVTCSCNIFNEVPIVLIRSQLQVDVTLPTNVDPEFQLCQSSFIEPGHNRIKISVNLRYIIF